MSCTTTTTCTTTTPSAASNCPPSPTPPFAREPYRTGVQTLVDAGTIDVSRQITILDQSVAGADPYEVALPDGTYVGQVKRIYINSELLATGTASWEISGNIAGYDGLLFNDEGFSAVLEWDGNNWQLIGGNVDLINTMV